MNSTFLSSDIKISNKQYYLLLSTLLFVFIGFMRYFDSYLKTDLSINGIVSFELAKDVNVSSAIINSWDETAKIAASLSMGFDFLFLIVYSLFIAELIHFLNNKLWIHSSFYSIGRLLIKAIFLAAFFDSIENIALIQLLLGDLRVIWSNTAFYFAFLKFILIGICLVYILINTFILLINKMKNE
jgi:hypothetical protein